jgi:carbonic anhydrase/acetyltransferase-like protein (isoleucine patch superfamily)
MMKRFLLPIFITVLPSRLKVWFLRKAGHTIGKGCYIGFSFIDARKLVLGDYIYIGHCNLLHGLDELMLDSGSRVTLFNWITGGRKGSFRLGRNSSLSFGHYFEASANIAIGSNTIVAGRYSQFFTHGITPYNLDDRRPIQIGDWCYVGSAVRVPPGITIADHTFVGMGSVITKSFAANYVLVAGAPAEIKREIPASAIFFNRFYHRQPHHPPNYTGG